MKKIICILFLFISLHTSAQNREQHTVDSLLQQITSTSDDTVKARLYNRIFNELAVTNSAQALQYARMGLQHVQHMKWSKGIGVFNDNLGRIYSGMGNYDSAIYYYTSSLAAQTTAGNKAGGAITYNNLGVAAQSMKADYATAAKYYFKSLQIAEEIKDSTLIAAALNNVAKIYMLQQNYSKSLEFDTRALYIAEKKGDLEKMAACMQSMGKTRFVMKDTAKARLHLQKALGLYENAGNLAGLAEVWSGLSLVYGKDYRSVVEARIKSKTLWDEVNPVHPDAITNIGNLGVAYLDILRYDTAHAVRYGDVIPDNKNELLQKAEENLKAAILLAEQTGDIDTRSFFTGALAEVQEQKGDFRNAYYNYKSFTEAQDSIYSQENKNKIAAAESQRELDKKNSALQLQQLSLNSQRKTMWGMLGGLVMLGIIGVLLYRQGQVRKNTNLKLMQLNLELDGANKIKAKFFGILSHDLRGPVVKLVNFLHLQKEEPAFLSQEQTKMHQQKITTSAEQLLDSMETILLWSKSQMERFEPVKKKVDLAELFDQLKKTVAENAFLIVTDIQAGIQLETDEMYLRTMLSNLVANAVKVLYNTTDATITLRTWKEEDRVLMSVSDNGSGFPVSFINDWNEGNVNISGRHGFGMHIVSDLAKALNCSMELDNKNGGAYVKLIFFNQGI